MKKAIIFLLVVLTFACTNENKFTVEGSLEGAEGKQVYFKHKRVSDTKVLDSAKLGSSGRFEFSGTTEYPKFYNIALNGKFATLLIKPGEEVTFQAEADDFYNYQVEGSPGSKHVEKLDNRLRETKSKLDSLDRIYEKIKDEPDAEKKIAELDETYREILNEQRDSSISFIINNMGSLAGIMALYQKVGEDTYVLYKNTDLQYIKLVADSLSEKYPQSRHVKSLLANKEDLMGKYKNLEIQQTISQFGSPSDYPDIRLPNLQGDSVSLNSLDDKIILLSFWASWSEQSIQRNLELMNLYRRYHDNGFEIYQVSLDQERSDWENAVNFDQLPWINVSSLKGTDTYAARIYNVKELPTDYLIHRERGVIEKNPSKEVLRKRLSIALDQ
ncbi:MAG: thioredoxin-like domain-containing protein [Bacteroidales bacterium]